MRTCRSRSRASSSRSSRTFRPLWVALGIVAAELLLALAIANHYRRRLSYRFWRRTHYLNFVVWSAATVHGLATGTDRSSWWFLALTIGCVALVCSVDSSCASRRFRPAPALRYAPMAAGARSRPCSFWRSASGRSAPTRGRGMRRLSARRSRARFSRTSALTAVSSRSPETASGAQPVLVRADLLIGNEGLLSTVFQMEYLPSGMSCRGHVTDVQNAGFSATCSTASGLRRSVQGELGDRTTAPRSTAGRISVQSRLNRLVEPGAELAQVARVDRVLERRLAVDGVRGGARAPSGSTRRRSPGRRCRGRSRSAAAAASGRARIRRPSG